MEDARSLDATDTAGLENAAVLAMTAFCWWRADLPREACETYWRDVHGIMFARVPGMWQCRQLRLAANRPNFSPDVRGISFDAPAAAQPEGMGHALFLSEAHLEQFGDNPIARQTIPNDARNFIGRIGAQLSPPNGGRTLVDRINDPQIQGAPPVPTFALCFVPGPAVASDEAFHRTLSEDLARRWSGHPGVMRLRVEPLPAYGRSAMRSPGVPHQWPGGETYLGWFELAVRDESVLDDLLAGVAADEFTHQVKAVHTYPVSEVYTIISAGRPTDVGLRGYPAVQAIGAVGAGNQRSEAVLNLLFGDAARGLDQITPRLREPGMNPSPPRLPRIPPRWFLHMAWRAHRALYRLSGGRFLWTTSTKRGWGALRLTTIGRSSGQERSVIVGYVEDGANLVALAMNGWHEGHPSWWLNLEACPEAVVRLARQRPRPVRARLSVGQERDRLWQRWVAVDPNVDAYAGRRSTETPVIVLEPRNGTA